MSLRPSTIGPLSAVQAWLEAAVQRKAATPSKGGTPREPVDKATIPTIHDAHPIATLDHIDIYFVGWEGYPAGKPLATPFEGDA